MRPSTQQAADCCSRLRPHFSLRGGCGGSAAHTDDGPIGGGDNGEVATGDGPSSAVGQQENGIDEDLYSRQLYVMGKTAMAKMGKADVLISGMR